MEPKSVVLRLHQGVSPKTAYNLLWFFVPTHNRERQLLKFDG